MNEQFQKLHHTKEFLFQQLKLYTCNIKTLERLLKKETENADACLKALESYSRDIKTHSLLS